MKLIQWPVLAALLVLMGKPNHRLIAHHARLSLSVYLKSKSPKQAEQRPSLIALSLSKNRTTHHGIAAMMTGRRPWVLVIRCRAF